MDNSSTNAENLATHGKDLAQSVIASAPWPMAVMEGANHLVRAINPAFCRLLEKTELELIGHPFSQAVPEDDGCLTSLDRAFQTGKAAVHQLHDDEKLRFSFPYYTVWPRMMDERPVGVIIQLTDATVPQGNLEAMNEALVRSAVRQTESMEALEFARDEAELAGLAKDRFLAMLSHELRTPLTPVLLAVGMMIRTEKLSPEVAESMEMIERNVRIEIQLIDQILDFVRIGRKKLEILHEPLDVHVILLRSAELMAGDFELKEQRLTLSLDAVAHHGSGDEVRLLQVFWNLLKNASKFTPQRGQVHIISRSEIQSPTVTRLIVEFTDSGIGFEPEAGERIFESFVQGSEKITREFGGLGLGLAISKGIVEAHEGTLRAASRGLGTGATFTIELPLAREEVLTTSPN